MRGGRVRATTALPYGNRSRAVAGLRARLQLQLQEHGMTADWTTFEVTGPTQVLDGRGRPWIQYSAVVGSCHESTDVSSNARRVSSRVR
jgi:hypothetical protein